MLPAGSPGPSSQDQPWFLSWAAAADVLPAVSQLKSEDFASLKQLVPLLEELSHVHPEPVIQELAADLSISICTHRAFSAEAVCAAACKTLGRSASGAAGQGSAAASTGVPDEAPRPGAPLPQKSPRSSPGEPQGAESVAKESSAPCTPPSLQELLSGAYSPDIPTQAAALRHLSRMVEQRDPGALKTREKLLKVGRRSTLWGKPRRAACVWLGLALGGSPCLSLWGLPGGSFLPSDGGCPSSFVL